MSGLSEGGRFGQDSVTQIWAQTAHREHVSLSSQQLLQVLLETDQIQERLVGVHIDQEIDVTVGTVVTARDRSKDTDVARPVAHCEIEDVLSTFNEGGEGHVDVGDIQMLQSSLSLLFGQCRQQVGRQDTTGVPDRLSVCQRDGSSRGHF
jgi:hypothetical protein